MNDLKFDIINKANYNAKKTNPSSNLIPKVETGLSIEEQMKPYIESGQYTEIELQLIRKTIASNTPVEPGSGVLKPEADVNQTYVVQEDKTEESTSLVKDLEEVTDEEFDIDEFKNSIMQTNYYDSSLDNIYAPLPGGSDRMITIDNYYYLQSK